MSDEQEYVDILLQLEDVLIEDGLDRKTREIILEAKKEIESLRNALTMFSEEFENIQRQDAGMLESPDPIH